MRWTALASILIVPALLAQDVPPPPRPAQADPALAAILDSLKETLLSSGKVEFGYKNGGRDVTFWQRITGVATDPRNCQIRIHRDSATIELAPVDLAVSYFFENADTVEVLTQQDAHDRFRTRVGQPRILTYFYTGPTIYSVMLNGNTTPLYFSSETAANQVAKAFRDAAKICRATPVALNAAAGAPNLADTLHFIEDKLNDNGAVNYSVGLQGADGSTAMPPRAVALRLTDATTNVAACQLRYNLKSSSNGTLGSDARSVTSFRRVEKLEVSPEPDALNRGRSPGGSMYATTPMVYRLTLTAQGGGITLLHFRDEEMANRIAKAMTHAVELCGGGNKDPF